MTIFVFAPGGKVPGPLSAVLGPATKAADRGVFVVTRESEWGSTHLLCTTGRESVELVRQALRLHATVMYLPRDRRLLAELIAKRSGKGQDTAIRMVADTDYETMDALKMPPSLPLFGDL